MSDELLLENLRFQCGEDGHEAASKIESLQRNERVLLEALKVISVWAANPRNSVDFKLIEAAANNAIAQVTT